MSNFFDSVVEKHNLYDAEKTLTIEEYGEWLPYFCSRWQSRFVENYYNVDLGLLPKNWVAGIEEILELIEKECEDFGIIQIKLKFGGVRFYICGVTEEIQESLDKIEKIMYNDSLVY